MLILRGDEFGERSVVGELARRVEFEGAVADLDVLAVLEVRQRLAQLTGAEVAEGTDDVAPARR